MTEKHFKEMIEILRRNYSAEAMSEDRVARLWKQFKNVDNEVFANAVQYILDEHTTRQLPPMSKFFGAVAACRQANSKAAEYLEPYHICMKCRDFGFELGEELVTRCSCVLGRSLSPEKLVEEQRNYDVGRNLYPRKKLETMVAGLAQEMAAPKYVDVGF